jgi:predicted RNase H-like HicB family nuclease
MPGSLRDLQAIIATCAPGSMSNMLVDLDLPEYPVSLRIEKLDEGVYLATSDSLQGLVAQGRTIAETVEIAQDVAMKLLESNIEHGYHLPEAGFVERKKDKY